MSALLHCGPMATAYLVTSGSYSDYGIRGAFSTREKAEAFVAEFNKREGRGDEAAVEEWLLDECEGEREIPYYQATMDLASGDVLETLTLGTLGRENAPCRVRASRAFGPHWKRQENFFPVVIVNSPESTEHAIRVAGDARQRWLAAGSVDAEPPTTPSDPSVR